MFFFTMLVPMRKTASLHSVLSFIPLKHSCQKATFSVFSSFFYVAVVVSQCFLLPVSHVRLERPVSWHVGQMHHHKTERSNRLAPSLVGRVTHQVSIFSVTARCISLESSELETNNTVANQIYRDKCWDGKWSKEVAKMRSHLAA